MVSYDPRYQRVADGLLLPAAIAGAPPLDFCNTRAGWNASRPREYLTSFDHLAVWTREAGLADTAATARIRRRAKDDPAAAGRALSRVFRLRDAIYAACTDRRDDDAWDAVAAEARRAAAAAVLVRGSGWKVPESVGLDLPALEVARAAGALLASPELETVGRCPGNDCGWLFLDLRGRRRWCTMAVCGNRAKARRHVLRTRSRC